MTNNKVRKKIFTTVENGVCLSRYFEAMGSQSSRIWRDVIYLRDRVEVNDNNTECFILMSLDLYVSLFGLRVYVRTVLYWNNKIIYLTSGFKALPQNLSLLGSWKEILKRQVTAYFIDRSVT